MRVHYKRKENYFMRRKNGSHSGLSHACARRRRCLYKISYDEKVLPHVLETIPCLYQIARMISHRQSTFHNTLLFITHSRHFCTCVLFSLSFLFCCHFCCRELCSLPFCLSWLALTCNLPTPPFLTARRVESCEIASSFDGHEFDLLFYFEIWMELLLMYIPDHLKPVG